MKQFHQLTCIEQRKIVRQMRDLGLQVSVKYKTETAPTRVWNPHSGSSSGQDFIEVDVETVCELMARRDIEVRGLKAALEVAIKDLQDLSEAIASIPGVTPSKATIDVLKTILESVVD